MINICFLLGGFQGNGGIGRVTSIIANEMAKNEEYNITTISYCQNDKPFLYKLTDNVKTYSLFSSSISMTDALLKKNAIKMVKKVIIKENIDILVACGALYYPLGILASKNTKARCFCWEHANPAIKCDYRFQMFARKMAKRYADKVIVLTKAAEKYYLEKIKISKQKLVQIYNPISEDTACSSKYNSESKKIISVGRLSYPKNFSRLVDIAAKVLPEFPEWTWDIYGRGEEYDALLEKIHNNGLDVRVRLMGQVDDLYYRYGDYAFQVMTSRYEGFPMALLEGCANRLPLVSFDIENGPNEIINNGKNGYLLEKDDVDGMVEKIKFLIKNNNVRQEMSRAAFGTVKRFQINDILEQWSKLCKM